MIYFLVIDEVDRLIELGLFDEIKWVLNFMNKTVNNTDKSTDIEHEEIVEFKN